MTGKELLIFLLIIVSMSSISIVEAAQSGQDGYSVSEDWWRIGQDSKYTYSSYHIWMYWLLLPLLIIALPIAVADFSWRLLWLLIMSYIIGTVVEDFLWYIANPKVTLKRFNPRETYWQKWFVLGPIAIPWHYIIKITAAITIWVIAFQIYQLQ
ncbi:MAG: hypothetical protein WCP97_09555 [bacterium]